MRELRQVWTRRFPVSVGVVVGLLAVAPSAWAAPPPPPPGGAPAGRPAGEGEAAARPPAGGGGPESSAPKVIDQRTTDTDLTTNWGYSNNDAPPPNYVRGSRETELTVNPIGYYQGVSVEGVNLPPYQAPELGVQPVVLTWTGFERTPNSSRAFFQLSSGTPYEVDRQGLLISIRLPKTSVSVRNNARRLDTSYFKTPLTELRIRRDGPDMVITLQLRREAAPTIAIQEGQNGYKVLVVEFPDTSAEQLGNSNEAAPAAGSPQS